MIRFTAIPEPLEVVVDENAIVDWLLDARPGDHIIYFRGFLGLDRCKTGRIGDTARRRQLVAVANRIMAAAEQGLVMPVQKRMGDVNSKTVTSHLRDLEKYHIINRTIYPEVPPRVEYSLTSHGQAFLPVFEVIREWGQSLPSPRED